MEANISGTGFYEHASFVDKIPEFDKRAAEHYWVIAALWKCTDPLAAFNDGGVMDTTNLVRLDPPVCYYCTQVYNPILAKRRCKGK